MNPRMFNGQQNKSRQSSAAQPTRSLSSRSSIATQHSREHRLSSKNIARDRAAAPGASLSLAEQDALLRQKALYEIKQGNYDAAIALFSALLDRNPHNVNDYNNRGLLHFQNRQFIYALADYNAALQLNPQLAKIYNNRGKLLRLNGETDGSAL